METNKTGSSIADDQDFKEAIETICIAVGNGFKPDDDIAELVRLIDARLARTAAPIEYPPGTTTCQRCEGRGVFFQCVICGSDEPGTGTCGSDDPRALCKFKAPAPLEAQPIPTDPTIQYAKRMQDLCAFMPAAFMWGDRFQPSDLEHIVSAVRAQSPTIPTDLSKRLRAQASTHLVAMIRQDILAAADEIDRYYGGMVAWKQMAEKKDAASASLWNALDLMVSTFERPIGMYANERKACDIARTALSRTAAPASQASPAKPDLSGLTGAALNKTIDDQMAIVDAIRHQRLERRLQNTPVENDRRQGFDRRAHPDPIKD